MVSGVFDEGSRDCNWDEAREGDRDEGSDVEDWEGGSAVEGGSDVGGWEGGEASTSVDGSFSVGSYRSSSGSKRVEKSSSKELSKSSWMPSKCPSKSSPIVHVN